MAKYGVWNDMKKEFQFGISEDSKRAAWRALYKKIGKDAYKWRFEIKKLVESDESPMPDSLKWDRFPGGVTQNDEYVKALMQARNPIFKGEDRQ